MTKRQLTPREKLEAELIRIDRTLALDRRELDALRSVIDELVNYRLRVESELNKLTAQTGRRKK